MMTGVTPFYDESPMQMYDKILKLKYVFPKKLNRHAKSIISHFLQIDLSKRYGNIQGGVSLVKIHEFFQVINFDEIANQSLLPPFKPQIDSPDDTQYFEEFSKPSLEERALNPEFDPFLNW